MIILAISLYLASLISVPAAAEPLKVAVIDTGFGMKSSKGVIGDTSKLCKDGHKDFSGENKFHEINGIKLPLDVNGHGTNIAGIISEQAPEADFCIIVIKFYSEKNSGSENLEASINSLKYFNEIKGDILNYSAGGPEFSQLECNEVEKLLNRGSKFFSAAGNNNKLLEKGKKDRDYYPAMYDDRIIVVGHHKHLGNGFIKAPTSNYGPLVTVWELGSEISGNGLKMTGTSQATAIVTAKYLSQLRKPANDHPRH